MTLPAPRVLLANPAAPHQVVLRVAPRSHFLVLSCTCLAYTRPENGRIAYDDIEARTLFPAAEAVAAWRAWHEAEGVELPS